LCCGGLSRLSNVIAISYACLLAPSSLYPLADGHDLSSRLLLLLVPIVPVVRARCQDFPGTRLRVDVAFLAEASMYVRVERRASPGCCLSEAQWQQWAGLTAIRVTVFSRPFFFEPRSFLRMNEQRQKIPNIRACRFSWTRAEGDRESFHPILIRVCTSMYLSALEPHG
jgi:hypothetical protein